MKTNKEAAMAKGYVHTVHKNDRWVNEIEGQGALSGSFDRKTEAVAAGRARAKRDQTEHVIHTMDGKIGARSSYGNDSRHRPG
jgi:hypothetical protein